MNEASGSPARVLNRAALRVVILSSLGGALEFYDFIVFGVFAGYLSRAFFPANDPTVSLLSTFAVFAVGYLSRPLGGLLFGWMGDRSGRRTSFLRSLAVMSVATILMGLLPTYAEGGAWATGAFVLLRMVQGFCLGGELPGAITYAVEAVPARRATLACGVVFGCVSSGVLLATGVSEILHRLLTPVGMETWGWRIAFGIGGLLGIASWALRRSLEESPAFLRMQADLARSGVSADEARSPLVRLMAEHRHRVLIGIAATGVVAAFNGLLFAHMGAYLARGLNYPPADIATALNIASAAMAIALVGATWVGDIIPRRYVYQVGCAVIALGALPAYGAMVDRTLALPQLFLWIGLAACFTHGTFAAILADLFPTEVRFTGIGVTMNIGSVLFSGLGPLIATWLIAGTGRLDAPALFVLAAALLALAASFLLPKVSGHIDAGR